MTSSQKKLGGHPLEEGNDPIVPLLITGTIKGNAAMEMDTEKVFPEHKGRE